MKPARSGHSTVVLPRYPQNVRASATAPSAVHVVRASSTSLIAGAGLKKCSPSTLSGRPDASAQAATDRLDVVVVSTAPGRHTEPSAAKTARLVSRSSGVA